MVEEPIYDMEMTLESIITMDKARWSNNNTEKAEVRRNSSILIRSTSSVEVCFLFTKAICNEVYKMK